MCKIQKAVAFLLAIIIVFALSGCSQNKISDVSRVPIYSSNAKDENTSKENIKNNSSDKSQNNTTTTSTLSDSSKNTTTSKEQTYTYEIFPPTRIPAASGEPSFFRDIPLLKFSDLTRFCEFDGYVRDWTHNEDTVYLITTSPNEIYIFNAKDPYNPNRISLPSTPNKIKFHNDKLYVSFSAEKGILVFNAKTLNQEEKIAVGKSVYAFDLDDNDLYYTAEAYPKCIYHYNISKQESSIFENIEIYSLLSSDLLYSKENNSVYICEYNVTGGNCLLQFNTETKKVFSYHGPDNIEVSSRYGRMHIFNEEVYWAQYGLQKNNVNYCNVFYEGPYENEGDIFSADNRGIVTTSGIFTKSGKIKLQFKFGLSKIIYTKSNYLVVINDEYIYMKPNVNP
ncbi:MAG: hypothetical protein IJD71_04390 [Clostridia bacterium]|nr:hypothetical protein [Clostridia bacterium]